VELKKACGCPGTYERCPVKVDRFVCGTKLRGPVSRKKKRIPSKARNPPGGLTGVIERPKRKRKKKGDRSVQVETVP